MRKSRVDLIACLATLGVLLAALGSYAAAPAAPAKSEEYGFLPAEIYKLDSRTKNLLLRDLNGDGLLDIVVVNNLKNCIDVLEQRKDPNDKTPSAPGGEINEIKTDWRLRHRKIAMSRPVTSLEAHDINGDGKADLVYLGEPAGLYVEYQGSDGEFSRKQSFEIADVQSNAWMLDVGDLNGDNKIDVAFLGKDYLYIAFQQPGGQLEDPKKFRLTEESASLIRAIDFDGDGRTDVVYLSDDPQFPVRARFQSKTGKLGPERRFKMDPPRGITYANITRANGKEMLSISNLSGRLQVHALGEAEADDTSPTSRMLVYPFEKGGGSPRVDLAVGDLDGDAKADVAICDSETARIQLFRQVEAAGLDQGEFYPSFLGTALLRAADVDGDGKSELYSLSDRENAIGQSRFVDGRLAFPKLILTRDEPVAMEILGVRAQTRILYVARKQGGQGPDKFFLRGLKPTSEAGSTVWQPETFKGKGDEIALELTTKPVDLRAADANGDGRADLLVFAPFAPPALLLADAAGGFTSVAKSSQSALGNVISAAIFAGSLDGKAPVLLVGQSNFARSMFLDPPNDKDARWKVRDQYNASETTASVTGVTAVDIDGDQVPELAMYDRTSQSVVFLKRKDALYRRWKTMKVGAFALRGMRVADFDHDGKPDLLLFDADKMGIAFTAKTDMELKLVASYESPDPKAKLLDMTAGSLSRPQRTDILVIDPARHNLEVVALQAENQLQRVLHWKVFEEKTFRGREGEMEPREAVIGDVNHDGHDDIAILVHDRLLVYLQDAGKGTK